MENIKIKNYYNKMSEDTKIILVNILADNLIYLHDFEVIDKEVIKSIYSLLLLFINYNTKTEIKEFDELLSFFKYLTKFSKEKVFMIYTREVKKYRMKEFNWDSTHTSILKATKSIVVRKKGRFKMNYKRYFFNIRKCNRRASR